MTYRSGAEGVEGMLVQDLIQEGRDSYFDLFRVSLVIRFLFAVLPLWLRF